MLHLFQLQIIQGVRHKTLSVEGVQFHPESIMTMEGKDMLANFIKRTVSTHNIYYVLKTKN